MLSKNPAARPNFSRSSKILASCVVWLALIAGMPGGAHAQSTPQTSDEIWHELKPDVFGDRPIVSDSGLVAIVAPKRAQDAAIVPIDIALDPGKSGAAFKAVTIVVDVNPAPVAAVFSLGKDSGVTRLSTRLRVNDYSYVRVIAETESGELHMTQAFIKASGGCSAPAIKNRDEAKASMGKMKLRQFGAHDGLPISQARELQLMIRHPNNSGLQIDQLTRYAIPPHFIQTMTVAQGGEPILTMSAGISISEDPNFRFDYRPNGAREIEVEAIDTKGLKFTDRWQVESTGL